MTRALLVLFAAAVAVSHPVAASDAQDPEPLESLPGRIARRARRNVDQVD